MKVTPIVDLSQNHHLLLGKQHISTGYKFSQASVFLDLCYLAGTKASLMKSSIYNYFHNWCSGTCKTIRFHIIDFPKFVFPLICHSAGTRASLTKSYLYDYFHKWRSGVCKTTHFRIPYFAKTRNFRWHQNITYETSLKS